MKTETEELTKTRARLKVVVPATDIENERKQLVKGFAGQAKLPGFRPGKAPAKMVQARYAKEIGEELKNKVYSKAVKEGIQASGLKVHGIVDFDAAEFASEEDCEVVLTVDLQPDFELPEYKGIECKGMAEDASEEDIEQALNGLRDQRAEYEVVERAAEVGDYVKVGYEGKIGDDLISELLPDKPMYGSQPVTWEEAGAETAPGVQAVIQGIIGMKAGDKKEVVENFAADFDEPVLAGKEGVYQIEVQEVRCKKLPEIDEGFLKGFEVESLDQLKERITEDIVRNKQQENRSQIRRQIVETLGERVSFDIPESAIESETQGLLQQHMQRLMQQGATPESFEEHKDELVENARKAAAEHVRSQFILTRIAEEEEIQVDNSDLQERIMQEAMMSRTKPEQIIKELQGDRNRLDELRRSVLLNKTLDFLVDSASVSNS